MSSDSSSAQSLGPLAAGFPPPDRRAWLAEVERTLKGAPLGTLVRRSLENIPIEPLYATPAATPSPAKSRPGWDIRAIVAEPDAQTANAAVLADLAGGAQSVLLHIDPSGETGVAIGSGEGLARALDGVLLEVATVALDAGFLGPAAANWLSDAAKGAPAAKLAFHLDPLSAFAVAGASSGPIDSHLIGSASVAARLASAYPAATFFLASGRPTHEAGGGEAAELAFAAACGLAYAKAMVRAGLSMEQAFAGVVLGLAVDTDVLLSIAKLRAARRVWARIATACGAGEFCRIEAMSSRRMLARAEPWTNLVRLTAAGFAGAVGGADAVVLGAFTDALGPPTPFARRVARNIQLVLADEAGLGRVIDPAGGSGALEALTDELARSAWGRLQAIEAAGGVVAALERGLVADWATEGRRELAARLAARDLRLLGVTDFAATDAGEVDLAKRTPRAVEAPSVTLPGPDSRCPPLEPITLEGLA